jgi:hypothetical protein
MPEDRVRALAEFLARVDRSTSRVANDREAFGSAEKDLHLTAEQIVTAGGRHSSAPQKLCLQCLY